MSDEKRARLERLADRSPRMVPTLVSSASELDASSHQGDWYIRASDAYGGDRVVPRSKAYHSMEAASEPISLQPMITAKYSGAAYISMSARLVEGVNGPADSLFRGGVPADTTWLMFAGDHSRSSRAIWGDRVQDLLERELKLFAGPRSNLAVPCVLEWIIDPEGRLWFVDLKDVPEFELTAIRQKDESFLASANSPWLPDGRILPRTSLALADTCTGADEVAFSSGSILSHLAVRLILSGVVVRVAAPQLHR